MQRRRGARSLERGETAVRGHAVKRSGLTWQGIPELARPAVNVRDPAAKRGDTVRVDDAPYLLELVQRHTDPVTRARSTRRKAAKGANAPAMALRNRSEPWNHITNPAPLNCPVPGPAAHHQSPVPRRPICIVDLPSTEDPSSYNDTDSHRCGCRNAGWKDLSSRKDSASITGSMPQPAGRLQDPSGRQDPGHDRAGGPLYLVLIFTCVMSELVTRAIDGDGPMRPILGEGQCPRPAENGG
jgi:hypothetical protein